MAGGNGLLLLLPLLPLLLLPLLATRSLIDCRVEMSMRSFCDPDPASRSHNLTQDEKQRMHELNSTFNTLQMICCVIGIVGNAANLRTLQSPSLQTVPFMYIRALALFDLISLSGILSHFILDGLSNTYLKQFYIAYVEAAFINTFLVAGLYCAFMLTLERYLLISRPHRPAARRNPKLRARFKIIMAWVAAAALHLPMNLQSRLKQKGEYWELVNNQQALCVEPIWTIFTYYKMGRECIRFVIVIVMTALNVIIARKLQLAKKNRRRLIRRVSTTNKRLSFSGSAEALNKREFAHLVKSFTEKKLTVLMIAICFIFILGNVPQMLVMLIQNHATDAVFGFQVYRNVANLLEVVNHCLNFYVFCVASSEFTRAFVLSCGCIRSALSHFPKCANYLNRRRTSSIVVQTTYASLRQRGDGFSSCEFSEGRERDSVVRWSFVGCDEPAVASAITPIKGILRHPESLTIVNMLAAEDSFSLDDEHQL